MAPSGANSAPAPAGSLVVRSQGSSWVEVRRSNGSMLFRGLLSGERVFPLGQGLEVLAGRPDLVSVRVGQAPAQTLGPISEVRWRSFPARP